MLSPFLRRFTLALASTHLRPLCRHRSHRADQLYGTPFNWHTVRREVINWLKDNKDFAVDPATTLDQLRTFPETWDEYIAGLANTAAHINNMEQQRFADNPCIFAVPEVFNVELRIYTGSETAYYDDDSDGIVKIRPRHGRVERVLLLYSPHFRPPQHRRFAYNHYGLDASADAKKRRAESLREHPNEAPLRPGDEPLPFPGAVCMVFAGGWVDPRGGGEGRGLGRCGDGG